MFRHREDSQGDGTYMAEDLLHDMQALLLVQAAGRLNQDSSQVWADQRLWEALQPQLQGSSQLQAVQYG